jgi:two-component system sensor histidine kinase KdpD
MPASRPSLLARPARPPLALGLVVAVAAVALTTAVLFPLEDVAPPVSLGVVYLLAVLLVSTFWGVWLGLAVGVASAAAFNFFHIPPTGRFSIAEGENWVALVVFLIAAVVASSVAEVARARAADAERGRREAELAAELARVVLGTPEPEGALATASQRIAAALELPSAAIVAHPVEGDDRRLALPLRLGDDGTVLGTLLVPRDADGDVLAALRHRVVPMVETLLAAALERESLTREVVETSALRRSDEMKTAVLRSVSHDLRSPLTAIVASGEALASDSVTTEDRRELAAAIVSESGRLARLVDKLIDLSRLQSGAAEPRRDWTSLDEVLHAAVEDAGGPPGRVKLVLDPDLPLIRADAAQLERAFHNLVENALRYSGEFPVSVRARATGGRVLVRVVDQGPGIPVAEQDRIFEPFYRGHHDSHTQGSGLGLAIVRGLVEANDGRVRVESLPGQGTSFVVELPLPDRAPSGAVA